MTFAKQVLHLGHYPMMWKDYIIGPADLDRANLRVTGMDTYALIAAVLLQVIIGLYGAVSEPADDDPRIPYPRIQRFVFELQIALSGMAMLCSAFTMVMFLFCKIYTVTALGLYKDVAYQNFQEATAPHRIHAFWSLIIALLAFMGAFSLNMCTKINGIRGIFVGGLMLLCSFGIMIEVNKILILGSKFVYS